MSALRILRHLLTPPWVLNRAFPSRVLAAIEAAVKGSEARHRGEIRFAVEVGLDLGDLRQGLSTRERAVEVFSRLRVWDTADNTGVLVYVQWVDRRVEIVADRGIAARVDQTEWNGICRAMEAAFRAKQYEQGAIDAVAAVGALLTKHFPARHNNPNELSDRPVLLR
ncbi:TPM domain-containing protein [Zoogloea sp.]|uniref:TPM domain-containing protein n=1 Tax=Zoogloea sp. TaxID=49181 RepID=UPI0035B18E89